MLPLSAGPGQINPIASTIQNHAVAAKTAGGDSLLTAREMLVDVTWPNGRTGRAAFLILFDPPSGLYLWEFGAVPLTDQMTTMTPGIGRASLYLAADRLIKFGFAYHWGLIVHESLNKANSIDDAQTKASSEVLGRLPAIQALNPNDRVIISVRKQLPEEFFRRTPRSVKAGPFELVHVSQKDGNWEVIVEGSWQEKITLNSKYQIVGMARIN